MARVLSDKNRKKFVTYLKKYWPLGLITALAAFFYFFRLEQTFVLAGDTTRDLIDVMNIWQNKIITVVGEPVNTISDNPTLVLFPSLYLYTGLLGLLVTNFNPVGSVLPDIFLTLASIPLFFLISQKILKNKKWSYFATLIYALSPVTVALARSYWEPNIEIPLAVFAWFFFLYRKSYRNFFVAGMLSGIIFDIHYMNFLPVGFYIFLLLFWKDKKYFLTTLFGFILAVSPLIAFEFKNSFFLTKAFMGTFGGFSTFSERSTNPFISMDSLLYIFGLGPYQYFFPSLVELGQSLRLILGTAIGIPFVFFLVNRRKVLTTGVVAVIIFGLLESWYFGKFGLVGIRYILPILPLLVIAIVSAISSVWGYLLIFLAVPIIVLSVKIITHKLNPNVRTDYYPVSIIEEISNAIVLDNPQGNYNITENILGDARSLALRFYLLRDAKIKPQPVEIYDKINALYVVSPSLEKTYEESRWEFNASGPKKLEWQKEFGDLKLYKFVK